jgi:alpha-D-xyloside xylohydrolase
VFCLGDSRRGYARTFCPLIPAPVDARRAAACPGVPFTFTQDAKAASIKTAQLEVIVNIERGNLSFRTAGGESLMNEGNSIPRTYEPVELNGDHTYRVTDRFSPSITEALYGLTPSSNTWHIQ